MRVGTEGGVHMGMPGVLEVFDYRYNYVIASSGMKPRKCSCLLISLGSVLTNLVNSVNCSIWFTPGVQYVTML